MAHDSLFEPVKMGTQTLKNRIIMAPLTRVRSIEPGDVPTPFAGEYYSQRAGAGLIIAEATQVSFQAKGYAGAPGLHTQEQIVAWKTVVDNVHAKGGKIVVQLWHTGLVSHKSVQPDGKAPISASDVDVGIRTSLRDSDNQAIRVDATPPRPATLDEIEQVIADFAQATKNAQEAGFDGIEIHGAHGYLIHQFHSPLSNLRVDEYGQDSALFGEQVVAAIREVVPVDMPLIMRVSAKEYVDGGYDAAYALEFCRRYKDAGVDMFHVSSGGEGPIGSNGGPNAGPAYQADLAEYIRSGLQVPVIAVGRLEAYSEAQSIIAEKRAELVAIGRGMLSDPYWALHAEEALGGVHDVPKPYERGIWKRG